MHAALRGLIGAVAGAALASTGIWLGSGVRASTNPSPATTTTLVAQPEPDWVPGGGIRFASTVIRPEPAESATDGVELRYQLVPLGASTGALPTVLPDTWVLRLGGGSLHEATTPPPRVEVEGEPTAPISASVRFDDLPAGVTAADIVEIAVTVWRVATPVETRFEMPSQPGSALRLSDGTTVTLSAIIEQDSGSILDFDVVAPPDVWRAVEANPFGRITTFQGDGPGWMSSSSTIGGTGLTGGSTGFQLRWRERQVPPTVGILYAAVAWVPLEETVVVVGEGSGG